MLAHVAKHVPGLCIQLFNQFFVILQFTRGIFGVILLNKKFLTTDHHLWTDLIYGRRLGNQKPVTQRECQYNACQCGSNAPTEIVPPAPCSNTTQPSHGMVNTRPVYGDDVLAALCHALTNAPRSRTAQLQHVESLLRDEWERPLDVIIPSSGSQQCKLEARHLRDVYSESYVTDSAEIVVYYWWLTRTALSADRDVMGVAWVVRDSLWNVSSAPWGRREVLSESWVPRT